jgi:hypothetical protein
MARSGFTHGYWIKNAPARLILRSIELVAATIMVAIAIVSAAFAQTLTDPKFQTKMSSSQVTAKSRSTGRMKSRSTLIAIPCERFFERASWC